MVDRKALGGGYHQSDSIYTTTGGRELVVRVVYREVTNLATDKYRSYAVVNRYYAIDGVAVTKEEADAVMGEVA